MCCLHKDGPPYAKHTLQLLHLHTLFTASVLQDVALRQQTVMDQTFTCFLLLLSLSATFGKYVYVKEPKTWHDAQDHCRLFHTDLAPISNSHDMWLLSRLVDDFRNYFWIGLVRNTDGETWMWSGGGRVSRFFWAQGQPENRDDEDYGLIRDFAWHDATLHHNLQFFCYSAIVVRQRKTWEEALDYCREHHHDLASVASETEMLLIKKELDKNDTTDYVWVGLHYFSGHWLWVDGQPLSYKAWGQGGKPACPEVRLACAALRMEAQKPSTAGSGEDPTGGHGGGILFNNVLNVSRSSDATEEGTESVWEARHCEERHYFICY